MRSALERGGEVRGQQPPHLPIPRRDVELQSDSILRYKIKYKAKRLILSIHNKQVIAIYELFKYVRMFKMYVKRYVLLMSFESLHLDPAMSSAPSAEGVSAWLRVPVKLRPAMTPDSSTFSARTFQKAF